MAWRSLRTFGPARRRCRGPATAASTLHRPRRFREGPFAHQQTHRVYLQGPEVCSFGIASQHVGIDGALGDGIPGEPREGRGFERGADVSRRGFPRAIEECARFDEFPRSRSRRPSATSEVTSLASSASSSR